MNLTLKVWRQSGPNDNGRIETYPAHNIPEEASFLEMLDIVNEKIVLDGGEPIHFDHDCREGICGMCSLTINGIPHGKDIRTGLQDITAVADVQRLLDDARMRLASAA